MSPLLKALRTSVAIFPTIAFCQAPTIHTVIGASGIGLRHFEFSLSAQNTLLQSERAVERHSNGDFENSLQFGHFQIFIPSNQLVLNLGCTTEYRVQMPRTENSVNTAQIKQKQALWQSIKNAVESKRGSVNVVIEIRQNKGCDLYFRSDPRGGYINHVGLIRQ